MTKIKGEMLPPTVEDVITAFNEKHGYINIQDVDRSLIVEHVNQNSHRSMDMIVELLQDYILSQGLTEDIVE